MRVNVDGTKHVLAFAARCPRAAPVPLRQHLLRERTLPGHLHRGHARGGADASTTSTRRRSTSPRSRCGARCATGLPGDDLPAGGRRRRQHHRARRRSTTARTSPCSGCCASRRWRSCRWWATRVRRGSTWCRATSSSDAIAYLSGRPESLGRVYQLADPEPAHGRRDADARSAVATGRTMIRVPLPLAAREDDHRRCPACTRCCASPPARSTTSCSRRPTRRRTRSATCARSGITCPRFPEYSERLVRFMRAHPEVGAAAMT